MTQSDLCDVTWPGLAAPVCRTHVALLEASAEVDKELFVPSALPKEFRIWSTITGNAASLERYADQNPAECAHSKYHRRYLAPRRPGRQCGLRTRPSPPLFPSTYTTRTIEHPLGYIPR
jgi:hypothetical protein